MMTLHTKTQRFFSRFQDTGSIGEGAERSKPSFEEKFKGSSGVEAAETFSRWDNQAIDQDSRDNWVKFDIATATKAMNQEMDDAFDELLGDMPMIEVSQEEIDETKAALKAMGMSDEEVNDTFGGGGGDLGLGLEEDSSVPKSGTFEGYVRSDDSGYKVVIQTDSPEVTDIEYYAGNDEGYKYMNVTDQGDNLAITAISSSFIGNDETYKETMIIAK